MNANVSFRQFLLNRCRDNQDEESLLVLQAPEMSERSQRRRFTGSSYHPEAPTAFGHDIMYHIILYYLDIIELQESANGNNYFLLHFVVHS